MMMSILKIVVLSICGTAYLILVHLSSGYLFDQQDFLLQSHGYIKTFTYIVHYFILIFIPDRKLSDDFVSAKYFMIAIIYAFIVALVIHGHQTEATYRLDFLWKLQATG